MNDLHRVKLKRTMKVDGNWGEISFGSSKREVRASARIELARGSS